MRVAGWLLVALLAASCAGRAGAPPSSAREASGGGQATASTSAPKRIVAAIMGDPFTVYNKLNIANSVRGISEIERMVHAGLSVTDTTGQLRPELAEAVPSTDNGLWRLLPDGGMETEWHIRRGTVWQDGTPFTADDLVFTVGVLTDPELPVFRHQGYPLIQGVEAIDPQTVLVRWRRPYIDADHLFSDSMGMPLPRHLLADAYATEEKSNFTQLPFWSTDFVGLGPFKLKEWERGSHVIVEANDRFVLGRPKIDEIEIRTIPDTNAIVASVLSGNVDVVLGRALSADQALQLRDRWPEGKIETPVTSLMMMYPQLLNPTPAVVLDLTFRRSVLEAIDRQLLADSIDYGLTPPADGFLEPTRQEYKDTEAAIVRYPYDPRLAGQQIERLGYAKGNDGFFRDATGQQLHLEIRATAGEINPKTMYAVSDMLQQLGIAVDPVVIPLQRVSDEEYRSQFPSFTVNGQPIDLRFFSRFHSNQARLAENNFVGENRSRYMNPDLDALIDRYLVTIPHAERVALESEITHHVTENLPLLPLFYDTWPGVTSKRLANVGAAASGGDAAWNAREWDTA